MENKYDVVIVGAGIGGLVCGCYLAKSGLKVLIAEQHSSPGGCCASFNRDGYQFDIGVHYVGSFREEGILFNILKDFELLGRINFLTNDPTDRIVTPDKTIFIRQDKLNTRKELIDNFKEEKENIINFFKFVLTTDFLDLVARTKGKTFNELLNEFFSDHKLKAVLSILLGNLGLPASRVSALAAVVFYKEYIFDGGYYPQGGMQKLPDLLALRFKEYGGELLLRTCVGTIVTKNNTAIGVKLNNGIFVESSMVVSNADATLTFGVLLDARVKEYETVAGLQSSTSAFAVYLGLGKTIDVQPKHYTTWFFSTYDIDKCYDQAARDDGILQYLIVSFPSLIDSSLAPSGQSVIRLLKGTPYLNEKEYHQVKEKVAKNMIRVLDKISPRD